MERRLKRGEAGGGFPDGRLSLVAFQKKVGSVCTLPSFHLMGKRRYGCLAGNLQLIPMSNIPEGKAECRQSHRESQRVSNSRVSGRFFAISGSCIRARRNFFLHRAR